MKEYLEYYRYLKYLNTKIYLLGLHSYTYDSTDRVVNKLLSYVAEKVKVLEKIRSSYNRLNTLPQLTKKVLWLRYKYSMDLKTISKKLNIDLLEIKQILYKESKYDSQRRRKEQNKPC